MPAMEADVGVRSPSVAARATDPPAGRAQRVQLQIAASAEVQHAGLNGTPPAPPAVAQETGATALAEELQAAVAAVRLASRLCQDVQQQLSDAECQAKTDESPVTVADYAAQAVVAWVLSSSPHACQQGRLSMMAEEECGTLRQASGQDMLARVTKLVNRALQQAAAEGVGPPGKAAADPQVLTAEDVLALIDLGSSSGGPTGRHWVLDPIDGTKGFVGRRQYSVCLGMVEDGEVQLGVLGCPNLPRGGRVVDQVGESPRVVPDLTTAAVAVLPDLAAAEAAAGGAGGGGGEAGALFLAHRRHGAFVADLFGPLQGLGEARHIQVHDLMDMAGARLMESYDAKHSNHTFSAAVAKEMGVHVPPLRMDSQVKYGLLSQGAASVFMRFPPPGYKEKIWDHCAGFIIVEEAGGRVTDVGGNRLDFSQGRHLALDRGIVAAPPNIHKEVLRAIAAVEALQHTKQ